ncbi:MAG: DUF1707 domain-containing protein [Streptosporangiaceae bacterium]
MTTGPGDDVTAGRGYLRASDADREQVIEVLKAAFAHGGLVKDEFEARIGQTFGSRTYAELADVTAGLTRARPARNPARAPAGKAAARDPARARAKKAAAWGAYGIMLPALFAAVIVPGYADIVATIARTAVIYLFFWLVGSFILIANAEW